MKKYKIKIRSIMPLLLNTRQKKLDDEKTKLKKDQLSEWEEKNWRRKAERDDNGNVILPSRWFRASFIQACKSTGIVPNFATSKKQTYTKYAQSMIFQNTSFKCNEKELEEYGAFVTPRGQGQIWTIRPRLNKWETELEIIDPFGRMNKDELKEILEYSGMIIGIGDGRSLNFGRFEIDKILEDV